MQIWQANSHGRYRHDGDANPAPLDPHFDRFAAAATDAAGRYAFTTVKPGGFQHHAGNRLTPAATP